jgi:hypothetical protein
LGYAWPPPRARRPLAAPPRNEGAFPVDLSGGIRPSNFGPREGSINDVGRVSSDLDLVVLTTTVDVKPKLRVVWVSAYYRARSDHHQDIDGSPNKTLSRD